VTGEAVAVDDRTFLTDGRLYLNARQAALYCGYEPTPGRAARDDKQMKAFYSWTLSHGVRPQPGRAVYKRTELDAAIAGRPGAIGAGAEAMAKLARADVADRRRRARRFTLVEE